MRLQDYDTGEQLLARGYCQQQRQSRRPRAADEVRELATGGRVARNFDYAVAGRASGSSCRGTIQAGWQRTRHATRACPPLPLSTPSRTRRPSTRDNGKPEVTLCVRRCQLHRRAQRRSNTRASPPTYLCDRKHRTDVGHHQRTVRPALRMCPPTRMPTCC